MNYNGAKASIYLKGMKMGERDVDVLHEHCEFECVFMLSKTHRSLKLVCFPPISYFKYVPCYFRPYFSSSSPLQIPHYHIVEHKKYTQYRKYFKMGCGLSTEATTPANSQKSNAAATSKGASSNQVRFIHTEINIPISASSLECV